VIFDEDIPQLAGTGIVTDSPTPQDLVARVETEQKGNSLQAILKSLRKKYFVGVLHRILDKHKTRTEGFSLRWD